MKLAKLGLAAKVLALGVIGAIVYYTWPFVSSLWETHMVKTAIVFLVLSFYLLILEAMREEGPNNFRAGIGTLAIFCWTAVLVLGI